MNGLVDVSVFGFVLFAFVVAGLEGNRMDEGLSDNRVTNDELAELLWIHCGVEFVGAKETFEYLKPYVLEKLTNKNVKKVMLSENPMTKQTLSECLQKKNFLFLIASQKDLYTTWYSKFIEVAKEKPPLPLSQPDAAVYRRRNLLQSIQPKDEPQSTVAPESATNEKTQSNNDTRRIVGIAIGVTAGLTFVFAALLFLCYKKGCLGSKGGRTNDARPLLCLSLRNCCTGASHKPSGQRNFMNEAKVDNQSAEASLDYNKTTPLKGNHNIEMGIQSTSKVDTQSFGPIGSVTKISPENFSQGSSSVSRPPHPPPLLPEKPSPPPTFGISRPPPPGPPPPPSINAGPQPPPPPPPPPPPRSGAPPPPPMPLAAMKTGPLPPPPPRSGVLPPRPPPSMGSKPVRPPDGPSSSSLGGEPVNPKTKLKPFFWDKVQANADQSVVWHQIRSGSFQFNEEMIETLFGFAPVDKNRNDSKKESMSSQESLTQNVKIIDSKKAQNLSILLRALNVTTEEVCDALQEGHELPPELLQTLLKMAPTSEEELKLRVYTGELSRLGPADRFLKVLVDIPFAYKRLEALLFMCTLEEEALMVKDSLTTLEVACTQLRNSRLFRKLLEAVLKTGNRMNDGTFRGGAQAFKLNTLLKLSDVKGTDGKTTLLHFVVQQIIRSEGIRAARSAGESKGTSDDLEEHYWALGLQMISGLSRELEDVKRAAVLDSDSLTGSVSKLGHQLLKAREFLNTEMKNVDENCGFHLALKSFVQSAEGDIMLLLEEEKRIMGLAKSTADYFHGKAGKDDELKLFIVVRDFLIMLDKVCKEVKHSPKKLVVKEEGSTEKAPSGPPKSPDLRDKLFPAIRNLRVDTSSSDDEEF